MTLYVGIDPGDTTGFAWMWFTQVGTIGPNFNQVSKMRAREWLGKILEHGWQEDTPLNTFVACERFVIGGGTVRKTRTHTPELIGELFAECMRFDIVMEEQSASDAKSFMTDVQLRRFGWYRSGQRHAMDAARHMGLLIARTSRRQFERLVPS